MRSAIPVQSLEDDYVPCCASLASGNWYRTSSGDIWHLAGWFPGGRSNTEEEEEQSDIKHTINELEFLVLDPAQDGTSSRPAGAVPAASADSEDPTVVVRESLFSTTRAAAGEDYGKKPDTPTTRKANPLSGHQGEPVHRTGAAAQYYVTVVPSTDVEGGQGFQYTSTGFVIAGSMDSGIYFR